MPFGEKIKSFFAKLGNKPEEEVIQAIQSGDERSFVQQKHSCPACHVHLDDGELETNLFVCPKCGHHFRITTKERIRLLADPGTWQEFGSDILSSNPIDFAGYENRLAEAKASSGINEAILTGTAEIQGRRAILALMSFKFMGGSMGSVVGERLTRAILLGLETKQPVVVFTASGGARMQEGIFSLMQMAKTSAAIAQLNLAGVPFFVVLTDPTYGGVTASYAMLGDVILAEPAAMIGFAGPRVIEGTIKQKLPEGFQRSEFLLDKGFVDAIVPRNQLVKTLAFLIDTHQSKVKVK